MNRHAFRWDGLAFGLFFLAMLGQWAVWEKNLLDPDAFAYVAAAVLIVLGLLGIGGTAISARSHRRTATAPFTPASPTTGDDDPDRLDPTDSDVTDTDPLDTEQTAHEETHGGNPA